MNAVALDQLRTDAHLTDTRHTLRVIQAQVETKHNPPQWAIGDHTPIGVIQHHWLDSGTWWYRLGSLHSDVRHDISEADLLALIAQNSRISLLKPVFRRFAVVKPPTVEIPLGRCSTLVIHERENSPWISVQVELVGGGTKTFRRQLHPTSVRHEKAPAQVRSGRGISPNLWEWLNRGNPERKSA